MLAHVQNRMINLKKFQKVCYIFETRSGFPKDKKKVFKI